MMSEGYKMVNKKNVANLNFIFNFVLQSTFKMENQNEHLDTLRDIRSMMEKSSRFVSLSGFAGVFVGIFALCGALGAYLFIQVKYHDMRVPYYEYSVEGGELNMSFLQFFVLDALSVLTASLIAGSWLSFRKAKRDGVQIWDKTAQRLFINMLIPLASGGLFCIIMVSHHMAGFVAPAMLIFYGLALVNASKFTFDDIRTLGMLEIGLGLIASVWIGYGLLFWAIGFGILHIVYGIVMYFKYER
jgi:hypothetical protein